jgi:HSP20 family protein
MNLLRFDPFRELQEMSNRLSRFFAGSERPIVAKGEFLPACDITEDDKAYMVKVELPEVKREDVKVTVDRGVLTIIGERHSEKEEKGIKVHRIERSYGKFERSFALPEDVMPDKAEATFKEGMLNILLPKVIEAKTKPVELKVS